MVSQRQEGQPRADGPPVVEGGEPGLPELLVLDPAGTGKHGEPPASWRELVDAAHVTWLRLPAVDAAVATARDALTELTSGGRRVHLVASGAAAPLAELLAVERPQAVESLLLVDPQEGDGTPLEAGTTVVEQALLTQRTAPTEHVLARHGGVLHVITYHDAARADRGAPLPLGHPGVVDAVRRTLAGQAPRPERADPEPGQPAAPVPQSHGEPKPHGQPQHGQPQHGQPQHGQPQQPATHGRLARLRRSLRHRLQRIASRRR